ncbi:hypothetical protein TNIN_125221 [Trichonephila inaurata madagascariensis]|uniref:Uncharacterized protein n=1 Tax=Trichonephila inaurata madagascariensis TaxID=2747483 RepID=A0A8X6XP70_9ARAC|nr:hypothetical protein TNIN_125221 [Trichonephila inaurata madagascariensis]
MRQNRIEMVLSGIALRYLHLFPSLSTAPIRDLWIHRPHSNLTNHSNIFNKIHRSSIPVLTSPSFCDVTTVTSRNIFGHSLGNIGMACCLPNFQQGNSQEFLRVQGSLPNNALIRARIGNVFLPGLECSFAFCAPPENKSRHTITIIGCHRRRQQCH